MTSWGADASLRGLARQLPSLRFMTLPLLHPPAALSRLVACDLTPRAMFKNCLISLVGTVLCLGTCLTDCQAQVTEPLDVEKDALRLGFIKLTDCAPIVIAKEKGLDLSKLEGSGPGGRVIKVDVESAASTAGPVAVEGPSPSRAAGDVPSPTPPAQGAPSPTAEKPETAKGTTTHEELSKLQATVARRMAESKATAPHFYLEVEVDMGKAVLFDPETEARI